MIDISNIIPENDLRQLSHVNKLQSYFLVIFFGSKTIIKTSKRLKV